MRIEDMSECPECLQGASKQELKAFGGFCEECYQYTSDYIKALESNEEKFKEVVGLVSRKTRSMKAVNNNNRYYCHRKLETGELVVKQRTIQLQHDQSRFLDKYARRLRDVYGYAIQLTI